MERYKVRSKVQSISTAAMDILLKYPWPGNVRELVNAIEYSMIMAKETQILPSDLPEALQARVFEPHQQARESLSLKETERDLIVRTLKECHGNKHLAAKLLRIPRSTLYSKIQKHGITIDEKVDVSPSDQSKNANTSSLAVQN
jgi:DNA-binding NtrC family response regulator